MLRVKQSAPEYLKTDFLQWPVTFSLCDPVSQAHPRYDGGRTHPYHPNVRPPFALNSTDSEG
jgi:hypothetical protein